VSAIRNKRIIRFIAQYGVLYGGMASGIGRNVLTYSRHYQLPDSYLLSDYCTEITAQLEKLRNYVKAGYQ